MSIKWKRLNENEEEERLNVKQRALDDAALNVPETTDTALTNCELDIYSTGNDVMKDNDDIANDLQTDQNRIGELRGNINNNGYSLILIYQETNFKTLLQSYLDKLKDITKKLKAESEDMLRFRKIHRLTREASPASTTTWIVYLSVAAIFFTAEVFLNGKLVGSVLPGGENEGKLIALGVAAINTIVTFMIGFMIMKNINLKDDKIVFGTLTIIVMVIITYMNWCYTAFRSIAETASAQELQGDGFNPQRIAEMLKGSLTPWTVAPTFQGALLFFIGLSVSVILLLEGYYINDKFPGYGSKAKKIEVIKEDKYELEGNFSEKKGVTKTTTYEKLRKEHERVASLIVAWREKVNEYETDFETYKSFALGNEETVNHLLSHYRAYNRDVRTKPEPEYFKQKFSYSENSIDPWKKFPQYKESYIKDGPADKLKEELDNNNKSRLDDAIKQADNFNKKVDSDVEFALKGI